MGYMPAEPARATEKAFRRLKGQHYIEVLKWVIFFETIKFLYRHMHLKIVETDAKNIFAHFQGHGVKSMAHQGTLHTCSYVTHMISGDR